jgi:hypothetical protein
MRSTGDCSSWLVAAPWYKTYVAGIGDLERGNVRASDRDRNQAGTELRVHCVEGRITFEELERRLERTMSARLVDELAEVMNDLPAISAPVEHAEGSAQLVKVGPPGIRPFTRRVVVPARVQRVRTVALDTLAPSLNRLKYELKHQSPRGLEFERTAKERIVISFEEHGPNETMMVVYGRASRAIRKTFAKLDFS